MWRDLRTGPRPRPHASTEGGDSPNNVSTGQPSVDSTTTAIGITPADSRLSIRDGLASHMVRLRSAGGKPAIICRQHPVVLERANAAVVGGYRQAADAATASVALRSRRRWCAHDRILRTRPPVLAEIEQAPEHALALKGRDGSAARSRRRRQTGWPGWRLSRVPQGDVDGHHGGKDRHPPRLGERIAAGSGAWLRVSRFRSSSRRQSARTTRLLRSSSTTAIDNPAGHTRSILEPEGRLP